MKLKKCSSNITFSRTEEADFDLYFLDTGKNLSTKEIRARHLWRLVAQDEVYPEDLPDDPVARCGYFFLNTDYFFPDGDPMAPACALHDSLYDRNLNGGITRKQADQTFLKAMLTIAKENTLLQTQAYIYYFIARSLGWAVW